MAWTITHKTKLTKHIVSINMHLKMLSININSLMFNHFENDNELNVFQKNMYQIIYFMHKIRNKKAPLSSRKNFTHLITSTQLTIGNATLSFQVNP